MVGSQTTGNHSQDYNILHKILHLIDNIIEGSLDQSLLIFHLKRNLARHRAPVPLNYCPRKAWAATYNA